MNADSIVYLLNATSTPLHPRVSSRLVSMLEEASRPSRGTQADRERTSRLLNEARESVAVWCGATPREIIFTSGGTEACNMALKGVALASAARGSFRGRILVGATEHTAVLYPARTLARLGIPCEEIPVDRHGLIDLAALDRMLEGGALLVSIALANAETGTVQPIEEAARLARDAGALFHTDACAAAAHMKFDLGELGVDLASFSAHKVRGPAGAGALFVRDGVRLMPLIEGGTAEGGRRGGAVNLPGIVGFGEAARVLMESGASERERIRSLGRALATALTSHPGVDLNGHRERRLAGLVNVSTGGVDGEALQLKLAHRGILVSSGSSCADEAGKPSHVLLAMGLPPDRARGSLLFALGNVNDADDVRRVADAFPVAVEELRAIAVGHGGA